MNAATPDRNLSLELVRVTEAAALAAGRWMGLGDRQGADHAAQDAMAEALNLMPMRGRIVSGEELRIGEHSRLDSGATCGNGKGPELDVEVNAIDGATLVAMGKPGALAAAALAPRGALWRAGPAVYMQKLVVDRDVADALGPESLDAPVGWTLAAVARAKGKDLRDVGVFLIDRPRHEQLIADLRKALESVPVAKKAPFEPLRGKLPWPVQQGKVLARFGQPRAGGSLRWQGMLIGTDRGARVRAPFEGRVVYADWLPGMGLMLVLDHGGGYLSLYGHNEEVFRKVGDAVAAGDVIGSVGDSGGHNQPALYFEVRRGREPVNPENWLQRR